MEDARRRALIAGGIGLVGAVLGIAGVGHAYLREWRRAIAWFALVLGVGIVLVTSFTDPQTATPANMPMEVTLPLFALLVLNAIDAYVLARRKAAASAQAPLPGQSGASGQGQGPGQGQEPGQGQPGADAPVVGSIGEGDAAVTTVTCPNCGKEVDADLDFCHWCTERFEPRSSDA